MTLDREVNDFLEGEALRRGITFADIVHELVTNWTTREVDQEQLWQTLGHSPTIGDQINLLGARAMRQHLVRSSIL